MCKNQKLYFSESFRSVESFDPSCLLPGVVLPGRNCAADDDDDDDDDSKQRLLQHSFRRASSALIFAGLVVVLILALLSDRICIFTAADRRVHRIEPKRQGFTLPLLVEFRSLVFSRMSQLPLVVFEFEPVSPLFQRRLYITTIYLVCLVVSEFRFG